ncbi:thiamine pyrophosphate-binding protein [Streptomyces sp. NPDC048002]|uniref:thiamine pyrophosphate-binding protein n=1 Tax=Streptomyces sp. NPDC048002 TaxID=3154344 RepID=UPI0033DD5933
MGTRPALALLEILRGEGVDRVFGNPGTTELPFLAALSAAPEPPEYVLGVHEGTVVAMADGYARGTRRPAFVSLHIAAGLANGLIGLLNVRCSRTAVSSRSGHDRRWPAPRSRPTWCQRCCTSWTRAAASSPVTP